MKKHYLHLSAYSCDKCAGPVISGSTAVRENEISAETEIQRVGAICLSCGHRQSEATSPGVTRGFPPVQWDTTKADEPENLVSAYFEESLKSQPIGRITVLKGCYEYQHSRVLGDALNRAELR